MKKCRKCAVKKTAIEFAPNPKARDGLAYHCIICVEARPSQPKKVRPITVSEKSCTKCNETKTAGEFKPNTRISSGLDSWCIPCRASYEKQRGEKKRKFDRPGRPVKTVIDDKLQCSACKAWKRVDGFHKGDNALGFYSRCKDCVSERAVSYHHRNAAKRIAAATQWKRENRDRNNETKRAWAGEQRRTDPTFRVSSQLRSRISNAMRKYLKGERAGSAVRDLGCTIEELIQHLERQFQPGMTRENYGKWHIDHILPVVSFDLTDRAQFLQAVHFTNLQPLWAIDNLKKGAKLPSTKPPIGEAY